MSEHSIMNINQLISNYYSLHRDEIIHFIAVRNIHDDDAQDMVQDLFLHLLGSRHLITPQTLPCLVYTMARNSVSDYYRRRRVYEEYEHFIKRSALDNKYAQTDIESVITARQLVERMERSLVRLPEACGRIYRLHIYNGLKVSDIAKQLELPYKQVENRLGQARHHIRQQFKACV